MRKGLLWVPVFLVATLNLLQAPAASDRLPEAPPAARRNAISLDHRIRLDIRYDNAFARLHGANAEAIIRAAVALQNVEWRHYRHEWFDVASVRRFDPTTQRDATYVLSRLLETTDERPNTIHVQIVGRPLEVYTSGTGRTPIGGLAFRGSDVVLVSASEGVTPPILAYYLFHELGHCWEAWDLPFRGGETTYGSKTRVTFALDAGNEEIVQESRGPASRSQEGRAPAIIARKMAEARVAAGDSRLFPKLSDLLLHEPSPSNPAYVAQKASLLAVSGPLREEIATLLRKYELKPSRSRQDSRVPQEIAERYWCANEAIAARDYATAEAQLREIRSLSSGNDVHQLLGAVEKKIRKRR